MGNAFSNAVTLDNVNGAAIKMYKNNTSDIANDENRSIIDDEGDYFFESHQEILDEPSSSKLELIKFKEELAEKREQRKKILSKFTGDVAQLKSDLSKEKARNQVISKENAALRELLKINSIDIPEEITRSEDKINDLMEVISSMEEMSVALQELKEHNKKLRVEMSETNLSLQAAYSEMANLNCQNVEALKQIESLKEVVAASKIMIKIREEQLEKVSGQLKKKVDEIQKSLADRESRMLSTDLREEYEKQLQNIRDLRVLYEERARLAEVTRRNLARELEEQKTVSANEVKKCKELTEKVEGLESTINDMSETIENKDEQINMGKAETKGLQAEMSAINKLFTQMLLGYKSAHNLDKLVSRLEENHSLLAHMVSMEDTIDGSALPKLLLDIVNQVEEVQGEKETSNDVENIQSDDNDDDNSKLKSSEEIVGNLPKVWRVLLELLSQQNGNIPPNDLQSTSCYKSVDTPAGPRMVPSVSKTYIRLKDLIVEKMSLVKDMNKMKKLNTHLESRLQDQERRLCLVTSELTKTWHVVGRLRRHHHQLHTHEKILRYELQQKRKLLNEIKEEFEYCKEKWGKAREKNDKTERELKRLRTEFASRRQNTVDSLASRESGYSDGKQSEDDSEWIDESDGLDEPKRDKKKVAKVDIHDSSTDYNLLAEGEDPISDMHDIADLPLDFDDHQEKSSQNQVSLPSKGVIDADDLTHCDSLSENCGAEELIPNLVTSDTTTSQLSGYSDKLTRSLSAPDTTIVASTSHIEDSSKTLLSLKQEHLAKQDSQLESLEKDCTVLLNKKKSSGAGKNIDETSDSILITVDNLNQNSSSDMALIKSLNTEEFKCATVKTILPKDCGESSVMFDDTSPSDIFTQHTFIEGNIRDDSTTNFSTLAQNQNIDTQNFINTPNDNAQSQLIHINNNLDTNSNHQQDNSKKDSDKLKKLGLICHDLLLKTKNSIETLCQMDENAKNVQANTCKIIEEQSPCNFMSPIHLSNQANINIESADNQPDLTKENDTQQPIFVEIINPGNSKLTLHTSDTKTCETLTAGESSSAEKREIELITPKEILENVREQDKRLQMRDERLKKLEENCHDLLKTTKLSYANIQTLNQKLNKNPILGQNIENDGILVSAEIEVLTNSVDKEDDYQASSLNKDDNILNTQKKMTNLANLEHLPFSREIIELECAKSSSMDSSTEASSLKEDDDIFNPEKEINNSVNLEHLPISTEIIELECYGTSSGDRSTKASSLKEEDDDILDTEKKIINSVILEHLPISREIIKLECAETRSGYGSTKVSSVKEHDDILNTENKIINLVKLDHSPISKEINELECAETSSANESTAALPIIDNITASEFLLSNNSDNQGTPSTFESHSLIPDDSKDKTVEPVVDHEARFAARDERLKRLEEQTKSLVDKVNGTTSKSIKLTFKLEELHNIYGSENKDDSETEDNE